MAKEKKEKESKAKQISKGYNIKRIREYKKDRFTLFCGKKKENLI
jgi:hypothetical protein